MFAKPIRSRGTEIGRVLFAYKVPYGVSRSDHWSQDIPTMGSSGKAFVKMAFTTACAEKSATFCHTHANRCIPKRNLISKKVLNRAYQNAKRTGYRRFVSLRQGFILDQILEDERREGTSPRNSRNSDAFFK